MNDVIRYGKDWLEILTHYRNTDFTDQKTQDLAAALISMAYKRFEQAYLDHWNEKIEIEQAARRMENEVAELLGTK